MPWDAVLHPREGRRQFTLDETLLLTNKVCDAQNVEYVAHAILSYLSLLDDSPLVVVHGPKPWVCYVALIKRLTHSPIRETVTEYAALAHRIMTGPTLTGTGNPRGEYVPEMAHTPVFKEYLEWWRGGSHELLTFVLTFLRFLKKMRYESDEFKANALRKWLETEEQLAQSTFEESDYMRLLRCVVHYLCGDLKIDLSAGKFGPGRVAQREIVGPFWKAMCLRFDKRLQRVLVDSRAACVFGSMGDASDPFRYIAEAAGPLFSGASSKHAHSRLTFAAKDTSTARSICMEPNEYMFAQQLVLQGVNNAFQHSPIRRFVNLRDQSRNQRGAMYGSITGSLDTIDLSSASDTVHVNLVRMVFPRKWLYYLLGTRVAQVELPSGSVIRVNKFAPMGSALCFPTQCILFTAVVVTSMLEWLARREFFTLPRQPGKSSDRRIERFLRRGVMSGYEVCKAHDLHRLEEPTVYGDDILCDSRVTEDVIRRLSQLGFLVNVSKSFTCSQSVRESCGKYYIEGSDITPFLYKPAWSMSGLTPARYDSLIGHVNEAWNSSYLNLRSSILRTLRHSRVLGKELKRGRVTFATPSLAVPYTTDPNGYGVYVIRRAKLGIHRINRDLQLTEELTLRTRMKLAEPPDGSLDRHEAYSYYRDTYARYDRDKLSESSHASYQPDDSRFELGWTPVRV